MWDALSEERTDLSFTIAASFRQRCHSRARVPKDSTNLDVQVPVFIFPRNIVGQLYHQALGSIFVVSYEGRSIKLLLAFASTVISGFCLFEIYKQDFVIS
jgi:hypothetical protein